MKKIQKRWMIVMAAVFVLAVALIALIKLEGLNMNKEPEITTTARIQNMIQTFGKGSGTIEKNITEQMEKLRKQDKDMGEKTEKLFEFWSWVNTEEKLYSDVCPDDLTGDDTLCIVVLGYQLNHDGSMTDELLGRLETALRCAEKYPNAKVAVTGGGTAGGNPDATEADCMAQWLIENGVDEDRLIIENRSLSTAENALFTAELLKEQAPQVRELVIVTSDYHIFRGYMVFATRMILGGEDIRVVSNGAYVTGRDTSDTLRIQASEMRSVLSGMTR